MVVLKKITVPPNQHFTCFVMTFESLQIFNRPKNRKDSSDFDGFLTKSIVTGRNLFFQNFRVVEIFDEIFSNKSAKSRNKSAKSTNKSAKSTNKSAKSTTYVRTSYVRTYVRTYIRTYVRTYVRTSLTCPSVPRGVVLKAWRCRATGIAH